MSGFTLGTELCSTFRFWTSSYSSIPLTCSFERHLQAGLRGLCHRTTCTISSSSVVGLVPLYHTIYFLFGWARCLDTISLFRGLCSYLGDHLAPGCLTEDGGRWLFSLYILQNSFLAREKDWCIGLRAGTKDWVQRQKTEDKIKCCGG